MLIEDALQTADLGVATMIDSRVSKLAQLMVHHSCSLHPGERVLIEAIGVPADVITTLMRAARTAGATPLVTIKNDRVIREICSTYSEDEWALLARHDLSLLKNVDAFIAIRGQMNISEMADVKPEQVARMLEQYIDPLHNAYRNRHLKWLALRWPTPSMAQRLGLGSEAFEDLFFAACLIDYVGLENRMESLVQLMSDTRKVRIIGPGDTDLSFDVTGMPTCKYVGKHNIPDGELFIAPTKYSVNGRISYNVPSVYYGAAFEWIVLDFKDGRVVKAASDNPTRLNQILDQDDGARYVGEFAFGFNPHIVRPMKDILFDEKMAGSIHLAQGNAYPESDNGNRSAIHWDLILNQTGDAGGGEVYFDELLVRQDGMFVVEELAPLNPERLMQ